MQQHAEVLMLAMIGLRRTSTAMWKSNGNRVLSKEQLQDAGLLPKRSKGSGSHRGGSHGNSRGRGNTNTASGGSLSSSKSKVDMSRSVAVFAGRSHAYIAAVLEPEDLVLHGASYVLTAGGDVLDDVPAAGTKECTVTVNSTPTENKNGVVTCRSQAVVLMAKCMAASAKVQAPALLSNKVSSLAGQIFGRYGVCVTSLGRAPVVAVSGNTGKEKRKAVSAHTFDIPPVPSSFWPVLSYNVGSVSAPGSASVKTPVLGVDLEAKSGAGKG